MEFLNVLPYAAQRVNQGHRLVLTRNGKPLAAVVSCADLELLECMREIYPPATS